ncbi:hypothetical protein ABF86_07410 [Nitrosomonas sp. GH22]|nr:hypothetical protein [Nitrosomonas sp. GH22]
MEYLARLNVNDPFSVAVIVLVDGAVDANELAMFVTVLYAGVSVGPELLCARKRRPLYLSPVPVVSDDAVDKGLGVGAGS